MTALMVATSRMSSDSGPLSSPSGAASNKATVSTAVATAIRRVRVRATLGCPRPALQSRPTTMAAVPIQYPSARTT